MRFLAVLALALAASPDGDVVKNSVLSPSINNPRNSEGSFLRLNSGILMFAYSRFTGGITDDSRADVAAVYSGDGGKTWSLRYEPVVESEGRKNVMSVSLLRLAESEIGLFYLRKDSRELCIPMMRLSTDEGRSWKEPVPLVEGGGYYVMNNDRAVLLSRGRIVVPLARHSKTGEPRGLRGTCLCVLSDNGGRTWRRSQTELDGPEASRTGLQEPGVVELKDGRLLMYARTDLGCQYVSYSRDGGETWSPAQASNIVSPLSPASIVRIPSTGDLLLVWNDHEGAPDSLKGKRTPLRVAVSKDEGKTWINRKTLEDDPEGWFCYTAVTFLNERVILAYCAGDATVGRLNRTRFTTFDIPWLYK